MGWFFAIFAFADRPTFVAETSLPQYEFGRLWAFHSTLHGDDERNDPFLYYAPETSVDTWEHWTDQRLYLSFSRARGEGLRARRRFLAWERRQRFAQHGRKRRKKRQYGLL